LYSANFFSSGSALSLSKISSALFLSNKLCIDVADHLRELFYLVILHTKSCNTEVFHF
jgi:hypothetical protein